jgi:hypothetical protein
MRNAHPALLARRVSFVATALLGFERREQVLKRRLQMRFIMHNKRILPEKARMQRTSLEADAVAAKEQPASHHVHRPDDYCRPTWVC